MPQYWEYSFEANGGHDRRGSAREPKRGRRQALNDLAPPLPGDGQHPCPRGTFCASSTRDEEGTWHPLMINSTFCPADESAIVNAIPGLPESYARLAEQMTDPLRSKGSSPGGRRPPGSRILLSAADDALQREAATVLNGWAARVRVIPGVQHSPRQHLPGTQAGVEENCGVLANWTTQLLALAPGPTLRTWEYLPGRESARLPAVPCRHCGTFVTSSPSGKRWWPAVCTHPVPVPARWLEKDDGSRAAVAWACAECWTPLRSGTRSQRAACTHEPSRGAPPPARKTPAPRGPQTLADVEEKIADLEVVRAGDGWLTVVTDLSGIDAGLDVLDLAAKFRRRLGEIPARPVPLEGVPCRECDELKLVEADPPHDPKAEKDKSRCLACEARMSATDYAEWTKMYDAWVRGAGLLVCKFCKDGEHKTCWWLSCDCRKAGHAGAV